MTPIYLSSTEAPKVWKIARLAFPKYKGRKLSLKTYDGEFKFYGNYWFEGSRTYYVAVDIHSLQVLPLPKQNPLTQVNASFPFIPNNAAIVSNTIFCGKDLGLTVYVNSQTFNSTMLPAPTNLSWGEHVVLVATRSMKAPYRKEEVARIVGMSSIEYENIKHSLIESGFLNVRGSITIKGKNAISNFHDLYSMVKEKKVS